MKTALVLTGGGANGAFQAAAERVLREEGGMGWSVVSGTSAGALNGAMIAQGKYAEVAELWETIRTTDVLRTPGLWSLVRLLFGRQGLLSNDPLLGLLREHVDRDRLRGPGSVPFHFSVVDLEEGRVLRLTGEEATPELVLASTAIPGVWAPVRATVRGRERLLADGMVLDNVPVEAVLGHDVDRVVVVSTAPLHSDVVGRPFTKPGRYPSVAHVVARALEVAYAGLRRADLDPFLLVNRLVAQAEAQGAELWSPVGEGAGGGPGAAPTRYRRFEAVVVQPDRPLGNPLDFSRARLTDVMLAGERAARRALEALGDRAVAQEGA